MIITLVCGKICNSYVNNIIDSYRTVDKNSNPIIISTWQRELTEKDREHLQENGFIIVLSQNSIIQTGRSVNYQLTTINSGLEYIREKFGKSGHLIIKSRTDVFPLNWSLFLEYVLGRTNEKMGFLALIQTSILYFADMIVIGTIDQLSVFYDIPHQKPGDNRCVEIYLVENYLHFTPTSIDEYKKHFQFIGKDLVGLGIEFWWDRFKWRQGTIKLIEDYCHREFIVA